MAFLMIGLGIVVAALALLGARLLSAARNNTKTACVNLPIEGVMTGATERTTEIRRPSQHTQRDPSLNSLTTDSRQGLLEVIEIPTPGGMSRIELHSGDLTNVEPIDAVDVLVVSAFPDSYVPTPRSLIEALLKNGVSLHELSLDKEVDLRAAFSCWISRELSLGQPGLRFRRILCFEPLYRWSNVPAAIGDIFRALAPFVGGDPRVQSVAMPIVATGSQGYSPDEILPPLLNAAIEWLRIGLPLKCIKIYARDHDRANAARALFNAAKVHVGQLPTSRASTSQYDAFISYAREDVEAASHICADLKHTGLRVYFDQMELDSGVSWQQHIFEALEKTRRVVAVYSPDFVRSKVCQEEFNIAWARGRQTSKNILFPVYWKSSPLPTYMKMLNYIDCREGNTEKLAGACAKLAAALGER